MGSSHFGDEEALTESLVTASAVRSVALRALERAEEHNICATDGFKVTVIFLDLPNPRHRIKRRPE